MKNRTTSLEKLPRKEKGRNQVNSKHSSAASLGAGGEWCRERARRDRVMASNTHAARPHAVIMLCGES